MKQSRVLSFVESATQMGVGYVVAIGFYMAIWPVFGIEVSVGASAGVALLMIPVNVGRQYIIRRFFNRL